MSGRPIAIFILISIGRIYSRLGVVQIAIEAALWSADVELSGFTVSRQRAIGLDHFSLGTSHQVTRGANGAAFGLRERRLSLKNKNRVRQAEDRRLRWQPCPHGWCEMPKNAQ